MGSWIDGFGLSTDRRISIPLTIHPLKRHKVAKSEETAFVTCHVISSIYRKKNLKFFIKSGVNSHYRDCDSVHSF